VKVTQLLRWQWDGYSRYHQSRTNLMLHIFLAPIFLAGNIALVVAAFRGSWIIGFVGAAAMFPSIALQGRGHRQEVVRQSLSPVRATRSCASFSNSGSPFRGLFFRVAG
jgi:hypothetical protein